MFITYLTYKSRINQTDIVFYFCCYAYFNHRSFKAELGQISVNWGHKLQYGKTYTTLSLTIPISIYGTNKSESIFE